MRSAIAIAAVLQLGTVLGYADLIGREYYRVNETEIDEACYYVADGPCEVSLEEYSYCVYATRSGETERDVEEQQTCLCASDFWDYYSACDNCVKLHGGEEGYNYQPASVYSSLSSAYCGIKTVELSFDEWYGSNYPYMSSWATTGTDVLGTTTDVAAYYTGTVTYDSSLPTVVATSTSSAATTTAATASATGTGASSSATGSSNSSGAVRVNAAGAGWVAGTLGVITLVMAVCL